MAGVHTSPCATQGLPPTSLCDGEARPRLAHRCGRTADSPARWTDVGDATVPSGRIDVVVPLRSAGGGFGRLHLRLDRFLHQKAQKALLRLVADVACALAPHSTLVPVPYPAHRQPVLAP